MNLMKFGQGTLPWQPILWHETAKIDTHPSSFCVLAFRNGWEDRKTDTCTKTLDEPSITCEIS